jgi:hypothetical protein
MPMDIASQSNPSPTSSPSSRSLSLYSTREPIPGTPSNSLTQRHPIPCPCPVSPAASDADARAFQSLLDVLPPCHRLSVGLCHSRPPITSQSFVPGFLPGFRLIGFIRRPLVSVLAYESLKPFALGSHRNSRSNFAASVGARMLQSAVSRGCAAITGCRSTARLWCALIPECVRG